MVEVESRGEAKLEIGWLEGGVALDKRQGNDLLLAKEGLPVATERVVRARPCCRDGRDRRGDPRRLIQRVANCTEIEEPVLAEDGFIGFQRIGIVWIEHVLRSPQRIEN